MKHNNPFAKLGSLGQRLYQETSVKTTESQEENINGPSDNKNRDRVERTGNPKISKPNASMPERQHAGKPESQKPSMPALQRSSTLEIQRALTPTEKVTYRFHLEGKYAIEDMKTILARKIGIKASCELIAEAAILMAYEDLLENQHASKLVKRLASMLSHYLLTAI